MLPGSQAAKCSVQELANATGFSASDEAILIATGYNETVNAWFENKRASVQCRSRGAAPYNLPPPPPPFLSFLVACTHSPTTTTTTPTSSQSPTPFQLPKMLGRDSQQYISLPSWTWPASPDGTNAVKASTSTTCSPLIQNLPTPVSCWNGTDHLHRSAKWPTYIGARRCLWRGLVEPANDRCLVGLRRHHTHVCRSPPLRDAGAGHRTTPAVRQGTAQFIDHGTAGYT